MERLRFGLGCRGAARGGGGERGRGGPWAVVAAASAAVGAAAVAATPAAAGGATPAAAAPPAACAPALLAHSSGKRRWWSRLFSRSKRGSLDPQRPEGATETGPPAGHGTFRMREAEGDVSRNAEGAASRGAEGGASRGTGGGASRGTGAAGRGAAGNNRGSLPVAGGGGVTPAVNGRATAAFGGDGSARGVVLAIDGVPAAEAVALSRAAPSRSSAPVRGVLGGGSRPEARAPSRRPVVEPPSVWARLERVSTRLPAGSAVARSRRAGTTPAERTSRLTLPEAIERINQIIIDVACVESEAEALEAKLAKLYDKIDTAYSAAAGGGVGSNAGGGDGGGVGSNAGGGAGSNAGDKLQTTAAGNALETAGPLQTAEGTPETFPVDAAGGADRGGAALIAAWEELYKICVDCVTVQEYRDKVRAAVERMEERVFLPDDGVPQPAQTPLLELPLVLPSQARYRPHLRPHL